MLSAPAEVLLSWMTGLGPIGQPVEPLVAAATADLKYTSRQTLYRLVNELLRAGCVRRLASGNGGSFGLFVVAIRLEALAERHLPVVLAPLEPVLHPRAGAYIDRAKKLDEIPRDRRSLTARLFGDPLFERSALGMRMGRMPA